MITITSCHLKSIISQLLYAMARNRFGGHHICFINTLSTYHIMILIILTPGSPKDDMLAILINSINTVETYGSNEGINSQA